MTIVTTNYRPKRAPRKKRKRPPIANRIVEPRPLKGPVIRLGADSPAPAPTVAKRSAIVETKRPRSRSSIFGPVPDDDAEEHQRRGDAADALWRELVRRATGGGDA